MTLSLDTRSASFVACLALTAGLVPGHSLAEPEGGAFGQSRIQEASRVGPRDARISARRPQAVLVAGLAPEPTTLAWARRDGVLTAAEVRRLTFTEAELRRILGSQRVFKTYGFTDIPAEYLHGISRDTMRLDVYKAAMRRARHEANTLQARRVLIWYTPEARIALAKPIDVGLDLNAGSKVVRILYTVAQGKDPVTGKEIAPRQVLTRTALDYAAGKGLGRATQGLPAGKVLETGISKTVVDPAIQKTVEMVGPRKEATSRKS